jgi:MoxR-like ATPase
MSEKIVLKKKTAFTTLHKAVSAVSEEIAKVIVGQEEMIELLTTAMLSNGHVLLEGVPGIAKTITAKLLAKSLQVGFSRIQFTPDLMPSDLIGTSVFNMKKSAFEFKQGPLFSNLILIDEINRAPAKTQAALFEVMEERQITVEGKTYTMAEPFVVIATQNPVEYEGTYRLPEAQLDRFLFKIKISYPSYEEEVSILSRFNGSMESDIMKNIKAVLTGKRMVQYQKLVRSVTIDENLLHYIARITDATRNNNALFLGGSPRASLAIMHSSKVSAVLQGRDFVIPEDIQRVAEPVLCHRIMLTPEKEMEGKIPEDIIREIIESIEVPR